MLPSVTLRFLETAGVDPVKLEQDFRLKLREIFSDQDLENINRNILPLRARIVLSHPDYGLTTNIDLEANDRKLLIGLIKEKLDNLREVKVEVKGDLRVMFFLGGEDNKKYVKNHKEIINKAASSIGKVTITCLQANESSYEDMEKRLNAGLPSVTMIFQDPEGNVKTGTLTANTVEGLAEMVNHAIKSKPLLTLQVLLFSSPTTERETYRRLVAKDVSELDPDIQEEHKVNVKVAKEQANKSLEEPAEKFGARLTTLGVKLRDLTLPADSGPILYREPGKADELPIETILDNIEKCKESVASASSAQPSQAATGASAYEEQMVENVMELGKEITFTKKELENLSHLKIARVTATDKDVAIAVIRKPNGNFVIISFPFNSKLEEQPLIKLATDLFSEDAKSDVSKIEVFCMGGEDSFDLWQIQVGLNFPKKIQSLKESTPFFLTDPEKQRDLCFTHNRDPRKGHTCIISCLGNDTLSFNRMLGVIIFQIPPNRDEKETLKSQAKILEQAAERRMVITHNTVAEKRFGGPKEQEEPSQNTVAEKRFGGQKKQEEPSQKKEASPSAVVEKVNKEAIPLTGISHQQIKPQTNKGPNDPFDPHNTGKFFSVGRVLDIQEDKAKEAKEAKKAKEGATKPGKGR
jgi:hypothetical protein